MPAPRIQAKRLSLGPPARPRLQIDDLQLGPGITAVLGPSGAGKSSLLNLLAGFEPAGAGSLRVEPGPGAGPPLAWVPTEGALWPQLSVREHLEIVGCTAPEARLRAWGLEGRASQRPQALSAGEIDRLGLLVALASRARLLLLDEPLAHVDRGRAGRLWLDCVAELRQRGADLVFATHEPLQVRGIADQVICLHEGRLVYAGTPEQLYQEPPTEDLALLLGPATWFEPGDHQAFLGGSTATCLRPEQLGLQVDPEGAAEIVHTTPQGLFQESVLRHRELGLTKSVWHRSAQDAGAGARCVLRVLALLLMAWLSAACGAEAGVRLDLEAVRHQQLPPRGGRLPAPRGLAVYSPEEVLVLDNAGRILLQHRDGRTLRSWEMPATEIGRPEGICRLQDGRIVVADTHYHRLVYFDPEGELLGMQGSKGEGPGQFLYPIKVVQDERGDIYVAEYGGNDRVQKFNVAGDHLLSFGSLGTGPGQFQRPSGLACAAAQVFVADTINHRIQVFDPQGKYLRSMDLDLSMPYDLCMGPAGNLWTCEHDLGRVTACRPDGTLVGRLAMAGRGRGQLRTPWGLRCLPDGSLLVADTGNHRIVEWRAR